MKKQSKKLQDTYWNYCKEHDYPVAEWRTRVVLNEREGIKSGAISFEPNDNNQGNEYESLEVSQSYRNETRNISLENKIESQIGRTNLVPKVIQEQLKLSKKAVITFRRATNKRQGSAEHIIASHTNQINDEFINKIKQVISEPEAINHIGKSNQKLDRYELKIFDHISQKRHRNVYFTLIIDKENNESFTIVSAHFANK